MAAMASVASAQNPSGYAPNAMMPGGTPPGVHPAAAQYHARIPAPPRPKLPRGVNDDGGLLFYNGRPYQDGSSPYGQQMHPMFAGQQAAYQETAPTPAGEASPGQQFPHYTGQCEGGDCGQCNGCCNDPYCNNCGNGGGPFHGLFAWLSGDGRGFPGKMGSVWSAGAELVYFTREHEPDRGLVFDSISNEALISAQQLGVDYEPGFRVWLGYMGPSGLAGQFIFLQTNDMDARRTVHGSNDLRIPFPLASAFTPFSDADRMTVRNETDFSSFEANAIYPWSSLQFLLGFRYFQLSEESSITATDIEASGTGRFSVDAINRMYGAQIGVLGQYEAFGMVKFDFVAKSGLFGNAMYQHQIIRDDLEERNTSGTDGDVSYISELNARVIFPLGPTFTIQAGYDVLFVNRLALATQQYDFDNIDTSGTFVRGGRNLIIHGISAGLTAKW
jgi:hypothetical protein